MASITLLGLEQTIRNRSSHIVFADGDGPCYRDTVRQLRVERPDTAVIVVNRAPDNIRWLDALESGATDYCGAPFEKVQVQWVLDGVERGLRERAAA